MEVILLERVGRLGQMGDVVRVKDGFARNFLLPKGKALPATEANLAEFEARRDELERQAAERLGTAEARAQALDGVEICVDKPVNDPRAELSLKAGKQSVKGEQALGYVRARYSLGDGGDLGRIERQQAFMRRLASEAVTTALNNPLKGVVSFALNTTKTNQTTDMRPSFWDTYSGPAAGCAGFLNPENGLEKVYKVTTTSVGSITASLSNIVAYPGVNSDIDVIILKKSGAAINQNSQVVACGDTSAVASSQPAGTYFVVVDGFSGSVAKFNLTVNFASGAAPLHDQTLPAR